MIISIHIPVEHIVTRLFPHTFIKHSEHSIVVVRLEYSDYFVKTHRAHKDMMISIHVPVEHIETHLFPHTFIIISFIIISMHIFFS